MVNEALTIEMCVDFCDEQDFRMAGLEAGTLCSPHTLGFSVRVPG